MKATGIVRRIDDLGRVVIPKEIRRTQHIRQGDPMEIFTTASGEVIFKKYSPIGSLENFAENCAEALYKTMGLPALICDRDSIIAAAGPGRREHAEKAVSTPLERIMNSRKLYTHRNEAVFPCEGAERLILAASPVVASGDVIGAVLLLEQKPDEMPTEEIKTAVSITSCFLAKQIEE